MSDTKLKPCPFCGGKAQIISREFFDDSTNELVVKFYGVRCIDCDTIHGQLFKEQLKAINSWNTRKPMEAIVERLEEVSHEYITEPSDLGFTTKGRRVYLKDAIEIVKEEGGSDERK